MINANIPNKASQSMKDATIAKNFQELINKEKTDVKKDENGTENILIGYQENGFNGENYGIKVSQQGFDVREATDDQLVFSSAFNMFKIVDSGTVTQTLGNPSAAETTHSVTYDHNLGYTPVVFAFLNDGSTVAPVPRTIHNASVGTPFFAQYLVSVDSTTVTFSVMHNGSALFDDAVLQWKYYLARETAS